MCGICGFIGKSNNPEISYKLLTTLFEKTESRGREASGFWGTESGDGRILYHKEPTPSTEMVKKDIWKKIEKLDLDLLLVHARAPTTGAGPASVNKNNHPFVNSNKNTALIHNGKIFFYEYMRLKKKYEVLSDCDSEIMLRIFESQEDAFKGIADIWSIEDPHMAIAIGEREERKRRLWLFRNRFRELWAIDLRAALGQIFFCSEDRIWQAAVNSCSQVKSFFKNKTVKLYKLPAKKEVWMIEFDEELTFKKYKVVPSGKEWKDRPYACIKKADTDFEIITELNGNEEPKYNIFDQNEDMKYLNDVANDACNMIWTIKSLLKQTIAPYQISELTSLLEATHKQLKSALRMLE